MDNKFNYEGEECMKVFVSWSGELSKKIAEELKKWIPCIIQSVDIFYSPEDIEKGERWNQKVLSELEDTNYGIVCLTKENCGAPWVNFEAGALAKKINEARVSTLLIDLQPSEISGPLATFQATSIINKDDFIKLVKSINRVSEHPIEDARLENSFNAMWDTVNKSIQGVLSKNISGESKKDKTLKNQEPQVLEELVQLVRSQNVLLNNPEMLLPPAYLKAVNSATIDKGEVSQFLLGVYPDLTRIINESMSYETGKLVANDILQFIRNYDLGRKVYSEYRKLYEKCVNFEDVTRRNPRVTMNVTPTPKKSEVQAVSFFEGFDDLFKEEEKKDE